MKNSVSEISGVIFATLQPHGCVPLKILPEGRREQQLPLEGGPSEVETGSIRQSGVESPAVLGGRVGTGRGREGWEFSDKVPDSPAGTVSGQPSVSLPSESPGGTADSQSPIVRMTVSPGRGGSHLEAPERGHVSRGASVYTVDLRVQPTWTPPTQAQVVGLWVTRPSAGVSQGCLSN